MYFPYLRGKQEEQLAVLEANPTIYSTKKVMPIFEPCSIGSGNMKRYKKMCEKNIPFVLILNPKVPNPPSSVNVISAMQTFLSDCDCFHVGLIVEQATAKNEIQNFLELFPQLSKVLIHQGEYHDITYLKTINTSIVYHVYKEGRVRMQYINTVGKPIQNILLRDGFNRLERNANYRGTEFFSGLHSTYITDNYFGFGDYQTIGDYFAIGGGAAHAVAIHLTYSNGHDIEVEHFVSDTTTGVANPGGKFLEALNHLIASLNANPNRFLNSSGVADFRNYHNNQHYPNLGPVKRSSIKHHLELISSLI